MITHEIAFPLHALNRSIVNRYRCMPTPFNS